MPVSARISFATCSRDERRGTNFSSPSRGEHLKKPTRESELLQIGQSSKCWPQFPEPQQEGTFARKAWHGDCFIVAAARLGARSSHHHQQQPTQDVQLPMCKSKSLLAA